MMNLNQTLWDDTIPMCTVFAMILTVELFALFMMAKGLLKFDVPEWGQWLYYVFFQCGWES